MKALHFRPAGLAAVLLLVGCASKNPPLTFGDSTTFGLRLGNETATGGASVSLGYKAQSVALVPITYNDDDGSARTLKADGDGMSDAMSVFAVFESAAQPGAATSANSVGLGQIFSTGLAAQEITRGICQSQHSTQCGAAPSTVDSAVTETARSTQSTQVAANAEAQTNEKSLPPASVVPRGGHVPDDAPYQRPLVFLRTDVLGIDMGGSLAEKGLQFVLGYNNRNLAFIPSTAAGADGRVGRITGGETVKGQQPRDTLSVVGQFQANTQTNRLGYDLKRYFATGVAARNLGKAAGAAAAAAIAANAAQARAPAAAATTAALTGD